MNTNKSENIGDKAPSKLPPDKHETSTPPPRQPKLTVVAGTSKSQKKSPLDGFFGTIRAGIEIKEEVGYNPAGESQSLW